MARVLPKLCLFVWPNVRIGLKLMNKAGQFQMFVTDNEDIFAKSDKVFRPQLKKPHNLAKTVESNESAPNRHTKQ